MSRQNKKLVRSGVPRVAGRQLSRWTIGLLATAGLVLLLTRIDFWRESASHSERELQTGDDQVASAALPVEGSSVVAEKTMFKVINAAPLMTPNTRRRDDQIRHEFDPSNDGWGSEAVADRVTRNLKGLAKLLETKPTVAASDLDFLISDDFQYARLVPQKWTVVYRSEPLVVWRSSDTKDDQSVEASSFSAEINRMLKSVANGSSRRVKFKVYGVEQHAASTDATALFEMSIRQADRSEQVNAVWRMSWSTGNNPKLLAVTAHEMQRVESQSSVATMFADRTHDVLGNNPAFEQQLSKGTGFWLRRLESYLSRRLLEGHIGFALGDVNADGRDDLYVCQPGGLPNRLLVQQADGTLVDESARSGLDLLDWTTSALIIDVQNDGHQDLAMIANGEVLVFAGDSTGQFSLITRLPGTFEYSLTAADYDLDGDLDLYACNFFSVGNAEGLSQLRRTDPLHDSNKGGRNALFRNNGDGSFVNVTDEVGLQTNNHRFSLAAAWEDYDNDGDVDLYVANDYGHNCLYRNDGGTFVEVAPTVNAVDANFGMSVSWGDADRDGWMDVYISNMFSAAGNRVISQPNFMTDLTNDQRQIYRILARGNSLLRNEQGKMFADVSAASGVTMGRWAWSSLFADINNDGWEDLLVTNGYLTQDSSDDL